MTFKRLASQPENPFSKLVNGQTIAEIPEFELECGDVLRNVPVAYKTWGKLNKEGNNCMVICHALTGSADVSDWWGPLLGKDKAFDPTKYFIICLNSLGSPYGSASPVTVDPTVNQLFGPEFPICTVRDDVRIHKLVLDDLGIKQIALVVGGSMGGMLTLEYLFYGPEYVKACIALATSAKHSAWCISWGEAQRQCIYSDPKYDDGYYPLSEPPAAGLGAARMSALLTYRSRNSFESKFGRGLPTLTEAQKSKSVTVSASGVSATVDVESQLVERSSPKTPQEENWEIHNDGNSKKSSVDRHRPSSSTASSTSLDTLSQSPVSPSDGPIPQRQRSRPPHYFSAQSYLRYQGQKFISRFDANCYISITRKLDTHDVGRDRPEFGDSTEKALESLKQPALVVGIQSDALFTYSEQIFIAKHLPNSELHRIDSPEGHDAFLLEFKQINKLILDFERKHLKEIMESEGNNPEWTDELKEEGKTESVFGEAEDVASW
ncbi:unnamed protein product [Kuraishia capsulata CBS 1993]|uniref:AB hydrolase-1 domain-containing protein n=1 Tax=Kuraishia capsulata CBS 1993 TaxID=1382522 RepID=W6MTQ6_9ASCO|nr:uncharacterized protein KUCA_T00004591001 [Kuraishia capsulata CBS 1993]CDK28607.1 unnamed protein product [Kuraishia capsulata CBS 1993]